MSDLILAALVLVLIAAPCLFSIAPAPVLRTR
jgi:hypothetical protein